MSSTAKDVKNYRTRVETEQAIKLTRDNLEDAANWCGGVVGREAKPSDPTDVYEYVEFPTLLGLVQADIGSYIVRGASGRFRNVSAATYEALMEEFVSRDAGLGLGKFRS